jgi:hypothetical protein
MIYTGLLCRGNHELNYRAFDHPNPDKPERIATKAPRHKEELFIII